MSSATKTSSRVEPAAIIDEIRECLRKAKPNVPIDDDFDAISAENRLLKEEKRELFGLLDALESRIKEAENNTATPPRETGENRAAGQENGQRGTSPVQQESHPNGRATPTKQLIVSKSSPSAANRTRWTALEAKVHEAWNGYNGEGKDPVYVWGHTDVRLTDDKIMANLQRQYTLHLVGFPLQTTSPSKNGETGPKVMKSPADERRVNTTSPGATNKRNVSPSATNRLPTPNVVSVAMRRTTPSRVTGTPAKGPEKETPQKSVTPSRTGLAPDRLTPVRRSSTPLAGAKSPSPAATTSKPAASKTAEGPKPLIRFAAKGSDGDAAPKTAAAKPSVSNGSVSAKPAAAASANGSGSKTLLGISAVLAQFKNIGPAETPRVPGDKRSPRPGMASAAPANSASSASLKREVRNEVKLGFAHPKPVVATSASTTASKPTRATPLKR